MSRVFFLVHRDRFAGEFRFAGQVPFCWASSVLLGEFQEFLETDRADLAGLGGSFLSIAERVLNWARVHRFLFLNKRTDGLTLEDFPSFKSNRESQLLETISCDSNTDGTSTGKPNPGISRGTIRPIPPNPPDPFPQIPGTRPAKRPKFRDSLANYSPPRYDL